MITFIKAPLTKLHAGCSCVNLLCSKYISKGRPRSVVQELRVFSCAATLQPGRKETSYQVASVDNTVQYKDDFSV